MDVYNNNKHYRKLMTDEEYELAREEGGKGPMNFITTEIYQIRTWGMCLPNLVPGLGAYHSGVIVCRIGEFSFDSSGIWCRDHEEVASHPALYAAGGGEAGTHLGLRRIREIIEEMKTEYPPGSYDVVTKNCHHFCSDFLARLGLPPIDPKFTRLPRALQTGKNQRKFALLGAATASAITTAAFLVWNGFK